MTQSQRVVLIAYCLLVVYCCVWVPWVIPDVPVKLQQGYDWVWSVGCEPPTPTTASSTSAPVENAKPASNANPKFEVVDAPPPSPCHGFKSGGVDPSAIALRLSAATALAAAAFVLVGRWKSS